MVEHFWYKSLLLQRYFYQFFLLSSEIIQSLKLTTMKFFVAMIVLIAASAASAQGPTPTDAINSVLIGLNDIAATPIVGGALSSGLNLGFQVIASVVESLTGYPQQQTPAENFVGAIYGVSGIPFIGPSVTGPGLTILTFIIGNLLQLVGNVLAPLVTSLLGGLGNVLSLFSQIVTPITHSSFGAVSTL